MFVLSSLRYYVPRFVAIVSSLTLAACISVTPPDESLSTLLHDWKIRAERGEAEAQYNLGWYTFKSATMPQDQERARMWFEKSASQGVMEAQFALATMLEKGLGVPAPQVPQAIYWYQQAAEAGLARAQYNLGATYAQGFDLERDDEKAYFWFFLAAVQNNTLARRALRILSKKMPADARIRARKKVQLFLKEFKDLQREREGKEYSPPKLLENNQQ